MFHVRRRPADAQQPRRRKKKVGASAGAASARPGNEPMLIEMAPDATVLENGRRIKINDVVEVILFICIFPSLYRFSRIRNQSISKLNSAAIKA